MIGPIILCGIAKCRALIPYLAGLNHIQKGGVKMRVKMDKLPSMTEFLKMHPEIKPETYKRYQKAIKSAAKANREVAKSLGGKQTDVLKGIDLRLRNLDRIPYVDEYINKLAMGWESRAANAYDVYTQRQQTYLSNILNIMIDDDAMYNSIEVEVLQDFLSDATDKQMAEFINALGNRGVGVLYVGETGEIALDFGSVVTAIHTYIMGDKNFLRYKDNKERVADIRNRMFRNRHKAR